MFNKAENILLQNQKHCNVTGCYRIIKVSLAFTKNLFFNLNENFY